LKVTKETNSFIEEKKIEFTYSWCYQIAKGYNYQRNHKNLQSK
jgi:hypothetical protein